MADTDLEYLLLQGQKLCKDTDTLKPVSKIHKSLRQLCRNADHSSKQLLGGNDEQYAKEFLANRGLDLHSYGSVLKKLRTYQDQNAMATCDAKPVMDYSSSVESLMGRHVEDYIKNLEGRTDEKEAVSGSARDLIETSWGKIKKGLVYNEFASDSYDVSFCLQNLPITKKNTHFTFDPSGGGGDFPFIEDVKDYIRAKESGEPVGELIGRFLDTMHRSNADATVAHIWNVVKYMHDITPQRSANGSFNERFSEENQTKLVKNAKNYLEDKYQSFLIKETRHLDIGGAVGDTGHMAAVIGSYVFMNAGRPPAAAAVQQQQQQFDFHVNEQSVWPLLYFCFRCGRTDVAEHFVRESGLALDDLVNVFTHLKDGSFTGRAATNVGVTLNRYYRTLPAAVCGDNAFRKTTFSLLGLVEANAEKAAVAKTVEDKLWMLLVEHSAAKYADASDGLDYGALQRYVLDHGKPYRDQQPHVYFELLFLVGQFESAVDFLYRNAAAAAYSNHAVHIAIGLREKRVLATPGYLQAPFLSNENVDVRFARLNYTRLVLLFCHEFESQYPHYAAYYYYFLRDGDGDDCDGGGGRDQRWQLFYRCVADLATSFDGNMCEWMFGAEGGRLRDVYAADTVDAVVDRTLELALDRSRPEVAIELYTMRSDRAAYGVMNGMLSRAIYEFDVPRTRERMRRHGVGAGAKNYCDRVYAYAEHLHAAKGSGGLETAAVTRGGPIDTFQVLRDVYAFFYHWSEFRFQEAVDKAADSGLVPFTEGRDFRRCLDNCTSRYGELVQRNVSHFLKSVADALCNEHTNVSGGRQNRDGDDDEEEDDSAADNEGSLTEDEDSDVFDRSRGTGSGGWTKRRLRNAVKTVYLFAAQLPVHVAQDAVEYISANASIVHLN
ncbi:nuclear pore complex protein Nup93-like [Sipha flava]|uniref:Nuclear pore protein n=1 Tax=Sipha flava TaxID=143950 RepID=A0A2S2R3U9_9HEMI|nr:nuclear pore complex protein Nup93-like [Sipha flava]